MEPWPHSSALEAGRDQPDGGEQQKEGREGLGLGLGWNVGPLRAHSNPFG